MRKFYLLLLMIFIQLYAQESPEYIEVKLIEKIFMDISKSSTIKVCTIGYENLSNIPTRLVVTTCNNADFIIISKDYYTININKPAILLNSSDIKKYKNVIGALYWKKGRPQLIFIKERLELYNIKLPKEYERFLIEEEKKSFINLNSMFSTYLAEER